MLPNTVIRATKLISLNGRLVYLVDGMAHEVRCYRRRYYTTGSYVYV
jgi:hypothetical protein